MDKLNSISKNRAATGKGTQTVFAPGSTQVHRGGRVPGQPNRMTLLAKMALDGSAEDLGELEWDKKAQRWKATGKDGLRGYFRWLGTVDHHSYVALWAKCLPQMVDANVTTDNVSTRVNLTIVEAAEELNARGVPTPALELLLPDAVDDDDGN